MLTHWKSKACPEKTDQQKGSLELHDVLQSVKTCCKTYKIPPYIYRRQKFKPSLKQWAFKEIILPFLWFCFRCLCACLLTSPISLLNPVHVSCHRPLPTHPDNVRSVWQTFLMAFLRLRHLQHRTGKYVIRHKSCLTLWRGLHQVVKYLNLILHVLLVCIKCQLYTDFFTSTGQNYRWLSVQWTCVHNALLTCSLQESSCVLKVWRF